MTSSGLAGALPAGVVQRVKPWAPVLGAASSLCLPLVVFVVWLRVHDHWAPIFDVAMFEMHVRDVGTAHTPLIGLGGRLGAQGNASHPGPMPFFLLAPVYRLFGGTYWALRAATAAMNAAAVIAALVIANRRAGRHGVLAVSIVLALLGIGVGPLVLTEPFVPYLGVFWFVAFLAAAWSIVEGDRRLLPALAALASICAQIHVSYVAVCGGIGLYALFFFARAWRRAASPAESREYLRSLVISAAITVLLWLPPIIEQLTSARGNLHALIDYFTRPPEREQRIGAWGAVRLAAAHLDVVQLGYAIATPGVLRHWIDPWPQPAHGVPVLAVWALVARATWMRVPELRRVHALLLASLAVFVFAVSRIIGFPNAYLLFPGWATGLGVLVVTVAAAAIGAARHWAAPSVVRTVWVAGSGLLVAGALRLAAAAPDARPRDSTTMAQLAELAPRLAAALRQRQGAAAAEQQRYFVTASDALRHGQVFGLLNELERRGFSAVMRPPFDWNIGKHRIADERDATSRLHLTTGGFVEDVRRSPHATLLVHVDSRTPAARADYELLESIVVKDLKRLGLPAVADRIDRDLGAAEQIAELDEFSRVALVRMMEIGIPAAVYLEPIHSP